MTSLAAAFRNIQPRLPDRVWLFVIAVVVLLALFVPDQAVTSIRFTLEALVGVAPILALSIAIAAYVAASGAENLIAKAFSGHPLVVILTAAAFGGLSPFCSCGVIPLIAALAAMGVPLAPIMAFWLASPVMDPEMFILTAGLLGTDFALAKTVAAIGLGLLGGYATYALVRAGLLTDPLREGIGDGGCGGSVVRAPSEVVWPFWREEARREKFWSQFRKTGLFLFKWLTLAFLLESLMLAWIPAESVSTLLGGTGIMPIILGTFAGIPAYMNGYAAIPLVGGLLEQGMAQGAALSFVVAGGVTSIPAAVAVWAIVRPPVFGLYIAYSLTGSLIAGLAWQAVAG